jgi:hypothetical protein
VPAYAGFSSLRDYLEKRCAQHQLSFNSLSEELGFTHSYIYVVAEERYRPSRRRADAIAKYFGDNPRIVRILAGLELPPVDEDATLSAIREVAASLAPADRRELLRYALYLKEKLAQAK